MVIYLFIYERKEVKGESVYRRHCLDVIITTFFFVEELMPERNKAF